MHASALSDAPPPWWLRAYLLAAALQALITGGSGLFFPADVQVPLEVSPLNARFVGALYIAGGVGLVVAALSRRAVDTRLVLYGFLLITTLILGVTLGYWPEFTADGVPPVWLVTYVVNPVLAALILVRLRLWRAAAPGRHALSALFAVESLVLGMVGLALLLAPHSAIERWPWNMTPQLARVYSGFLLGFAVSAAFSVLERRRAATLAFTCTSVVLCALVLAGSGLHLERFKEGLPRWGWFGGWSAGAVAFLAALFVTAGALLGRARVDAAATASEGGPAAHAERVEPA